MALDEKSDDGDPLKFLIKSNDPARDETRIVCQVSYRVLDTFFPFLLTKYPLHKWLSTFFCQAVSIFFKFWSHKIYNHGAA